MAERTFQSILYEKDRDSGVVTVTLNRPDIKNALTLRVLLELRWAADAVRTDDEATALIITGAPPGDGGDPANEAFCSGGYFNPADLASLDEEMLREIDLTDIAQKALCLNLWSLYKPVVAAINGLAIGGGLTVPMACADLIFASEHAWGRLPFVSLGIVPELASSYLLPRMVGMQKAKEIMFFGEKMTAREMFEMGIVNRVLPHGELLSHTREAVLRLVPPRGAWKAVRRAKEILHQPLVEAVTRSLDRENEALNELFASKDFVEAIAARREKRAPVFIGA
ncbi:MAG: enoyl-CoA hydratase/isomerase family protein [Deltaproteobacteria bacterium]|nr:enoyl-CoA hydratase/isomerase family protein [Deltaproteobacteria bacterium]